MVKRGGIVSAKLCALQRIFVYKLHYELVSPLRAVTPTLWEEN
jgi:hypothetical protein